MKLQYLLKLGPVELTGNVVNVYLRVKESGEVASPVFALNDIEGLQELVAGESSKECRCEPALQEAANTLSIQVLEPPPRTLQSRAAIAVFMAWGQKGVSAAGSEMALLLMQAATDFWDAHPWVYWDERQPIRFVFQGALDQAYEGSIFGSKEQGFGLALYEDAGALEKLLALQASGDLSLARKLPAIGVMLDDRPSYVIEALEAAGQVPRLPIPIKTGQAGPAVPTPAECLALVAALRASSGLSETMRSASFEVSLRGLKLSVQVHAPTARVRN